MVYVVLILGLVFLVLGMVNILVVFKLGKFLDKIGL